MTPLGKRVLIEAQRITESPGGILLPMENLSNPLTRGIVRAIGKGVEEVAVGDSVLFPTGTGVVCLDMGSEFRLMDEVSLYAKIETRKENHRGTIGKG